jgi:ABC-2 type transport system permease protein
MTPAVVTSPPAVRRLGAVLAMEWTKLRTVPEAVVALPLTVVLTVGVSLVGSLAGSPDVVHSSLIGVQVGQAVVAVWAVQVLAGEFGTGLIRPTFTAVPRRLTVLAAKAAFVLAGVLAAALLSAVVSVAVGRALLVGYPPLTAGVVVRAALGSVAYLGLVALFGLGVAAIVRNAVGAIGVVLGLLYLVPVIQRLFLDEHVQRWIYKVGPSTAGLSILTTVGASQLPLRPWAGLAVTAAWAAGALGVGALILRNCDV